MTGLIALFVAVASAEVLLRLAVDDNLRGQTERVIFPAAVGGLALSVCLVAGLLVAAAMRKLHAPSGA